MYKDLEVTSLRWAHRSTSRVIGHHWNHPIITLVSIVDKVAVLVLLCHFAVASLGVAAHLEPTHLVSAQALDGLGATNVLGGVPKTLRQVSVPVPAPELFVVDKTLDNLFSVVELTPVSGSLVLSEVLSLFDTRVVVDSSLLASIKEPLGVVGSIGGESFRPLEGTVLLVAVLVVTPGVPILTSGVVGIEVRPITRAHSISPIMSNFEVVANLSHPAAAVDEFLSVDHELELSVTIPTADTVEVIEGQGVLARCKAASADCFGVVGGNDSAHGGNRTSTRVLNLPRSLVSILVDFCVYLSVVTALGLEVEAWAGVVDTNVVATASAVAVAAVKGTPPRATNGNSELMVLDLPIGIHTGHIHHLGSIDRDAVPSLSILAAQTIAHGILHTKSVVPGSKTH